MKKVTKRTTKKTIRTPRNNTSGGHEALGRGRMLCMRDVGPSEKARSAGRNFDLSTHEIACSIHQSDSPDRCPDACQYKKGSL